MIDIISTYLNLPSPIELVDWTSLGIRLHVKRDDLIHPVISGNKWRKLSGHLDVYKHGEFEGIVSMGSAYSNHLHALSYVCFQLNIPCTCFIYSHGPFEDNPTLADCLSWNSKCTSITRVQAAQLRSHMDNSLEVEGKKRMWIPEGGGGANGELGIRQMVSEFPEDFDQSDHLVLCACGTGTTLKGMLNDTKNLFIASKRVVRNAVYDFDKSTRLIWMEPEALHKFSKVNEELELFINGFKHQTGIMLDCVYTGPLLFSFSKEQHLHAFNKIYFIHTGGLQGNRMH